MRGHANTPRTPPRPEPVDPAAGDDPDSLEGLEALWLRPPRAERTPTLSRDAIVAAAIEIADAEGLDAVSIRRVAGALRARPMSLYSHIGRKRDLTDLMANEVVGECLVPGELPADWRAALRMIAYHTRDVAYRHPWMLKADSVRVGLSPNALRHLEQSLGALSGLDVEEDRKIEILVAVDTYTIGQIVRELVALRESQPTGEAKTRPVVQAPKVRGRARRLVSDATPAYDGPTREAPTRSAPTRGARIRAAEGYLRRLLETGEYPLIAGLGIDVVAHAYESTSDVADRRFEEGLNWLLNGIAASLASESGGGPAVR